MRLPPFLFFLKEPSTFSRPSVSIQTEGKNGGDGLQDEFARIYQGLISRLEPDPVRLRRGLQTIPPVLSGTEQGGSGGTPLQVQEKCDIRDTEASSNRKTRESGETT